jgi:sulfatase maturation enzyme AslB (radical SAM superfamily)
MKSAEIFRAWGSILVGRAPSLSIEITRECPLRCPGCYAYGEDHIDGVAGGLRSLADFKGDELVRRVLAIADRERPLHLSIVGGDPLVRYRELEQLLPELSSRGIHVQVVTSAFRRIPLEWAKIKNLNVTVSIDGLQPEHDIRRRPATYERILKNFAGHKRFFSVHCTVTKQMLQRSGYLYDFAEFWSARPEPKRIWFSGFTPQIGDQSNERIPMEMRGVLVERLLELKKNFPLVDMADGAIRNLVDPPKSPEECTFAQTTKTISADLVSVVKPCQFGGKPDCSQCGCIASIALHAVGKHKLGGVVRLRTIFKASTRIGSLVARTRNAPEEEVTELLPIIQSKTGTAD